jgi:hypothetical protein
MDVGAKPLGVKIQGPVFARTSLAGRPRKPSLQANRSRISVLKRTIEAGSRSARRSPATLGTPSTV